MITAVIIDAQKQERDQIETLLAAQGDIKVVARGNDGYDALKLIGSLKPSVAILDIHLEFIKGEEIPPLLKARSPSTAVLILASRISDYQLYRAVVNKVSGVICKETTMDCLPSILKYISEGGYFVSPPFAARVQHIVAAMSRNSMAIHGFSAAHPRGKMPEKQSGDTKIPSREDPAGFLSKMELRILACIGEGYASNEIACNLNLAVGTVRNYISAVMRKTGLRNRSQMARYAFYYGLVPLNKGLGQKHNLPYSGEQLTIAVECKPEF